MTFHSNGGIEIEGKNYTKADGSSCKALSDAMRDAIGGGLVSELKKPEFQETAKTRVTQ